MMEDDSLNKRARHIVPPPSEPLQRITQWRMAPVNVVIANTDVFDAEGDVTIELHASVDQYDMTETMEYFTSIAGDDLPLLMSLTSMASMSLNAKSTSCLDDIEGVIAKIQRLSVTRRQYAIMQAIGFACYFEMSKGGMMRREVFKTVPLFPVFIRMLCTTVKDADAIVEKWRIYGAMRVLTSWVARRFFNKGLDIHKMMHDVHAPYFLEHYRRLPYVLNVLFRHVKSQRHAYIKFLVNDLIGYDILYVFFAPKQVTRIHHRLLSEARYIEEKLDADIRSDHAEFYAVVEQLKEWSCLDELLDQNLVFVPQCDARWSIDVPKLQMLTFKIACDPRVPTSTAMSLMLSLVASSRDDGKTVQYLENLITPYYMIKRKDDIMRIKSRDRPRKELPEIEAKVYYDLLFTDVYQKDIYDVVATFQTKVRTVKQWKSKLGIHELITEDDYVARTREASTLYRGVETELRLHAGWTSPLVFFLQDLDNYYTRFKRRLKPTYDAWETCVSTERLLPLSNDGESFLDRVFFHL